MNLQYPKLGRPLGAPLAERGYIVNYSIRGSGAEKIHIETFAGSFQERSLIIPTPGIILGRFGIAVEPFWKPFQARLQVPSWKSITWRTVLYKPNG